MKDFNNAPTAIGGALASFVSYSMAANGDGSDDDCCDGSCDCHFAIAHATPPDDSVAAVTCSR
jgi:hypothetical protein